MAMGRRRGSDLGTREAVAAWTREAWLRRSFTRPSSQLLEPAHTSLTWCSVKSSEREKERERERERGRERQRGRERERERRSRRSF